LKQANVNISKLKKQEVLSWVSNLNNMTMWVSIVFNWLYTLSSKNHLITFEVLIALWSVI
jgi:hypothetical protein